jgi:hypothetical protein
MLLKMHATSRVSALIRRTLGGVLMASLVAGCSMVPNMDHGSSGCENAVGIGPRSGDAPVIKSLDDSAIPELNGLSAAAAATAAVAQGHTVVFNVQITGFGECWCVPPPEGTVVTSWWNSHGALFLQVDGVDEGHTPDNQPAAGWGC